MIEQRKTVLADLLRALEGISVGDLAVAGNGLISHHELALALVGNPKSRRPAANHRTAPNFRGTYLTMRAPARAPLLRQRL